MKKIIYLLILSFSVLFLFNRDLRSELMHVTENLHGERVLLPASAPDRGGLILVSFVKVLAGAEIVAALALYDDPRSKRSVDYVEVYDPIGGLLLISWVDRFGIRRIAMDQGLLEGGASKLEGVLVLLPLGTPL